MKRSLNGLLFAILPCVWMAGCQASSFESVLRQTSSSDDTATLSQRNSGAMSRGSTLVSIRANVVPDNETHGLIVLATTWNKPIGMKWIDTKHLELTCSSCTAQDVTFEVVKTGDITISYDDNLRVH